MILLLGIVGVFLFVGFVACSPLILIALVIAVIVTHFRK